MSIVRRDYIEQMIEQLAQALATLLFGQKKPPQEVKETLAEVTQRLLGMEYRVLSAWTRRAPRRYWVSP